MGGPEVTGRLIRMIAADVLVGLVAIYCAALLRFFDFYPLDRLGPELFFYIASALLTPFLFLWLGVYEDVSRQGVRFFRRLVGVTASVVVTGYVVRTSLELNAWPRSLPVLYFCFSSFGFLAWRLYFSRTFKTFLAVRGIPVIVYGAGDAGRLFVQQQRASQDYFPMVFIDDDPEKHGKDVDGIRVHPAEEVESLMEELSPVFVILALPSASRVDRQLIITELAARNIPMQTLSQKAVIDSGGMIKSVEDLNYEDLIGRPAVDQKTLGDLTKYLVGQVVLVTGAGGTIGSALCESLIRLGVKELIVLDQSEFGLYKLALKIDALLATTGVKIYFRSYMGSVSSRGLVRQILSKHGITLVLHAAAYKHVGMVEKNVAQGIENNVFGTEILLDEIVKASSVLKFVLVSSDKAVRPTNVMGATKRLAELMVMRAAKMHPSKRFGIVRFGNVIGSSGSVVPKFLHQIKNGQDVTVSHPDVTRYFMTPSEASDLILLCSLMSRQGEVYLLDMGNPVKIFDLAKQLVNLCGRRVSNLTDTRSTKIVFSGLGVGEKMYEELLINDGSRHEKYARIFLGNEDQIDWDSFDVNYKKLKPTETGFSICSLDERKLKRLLQMLVTEYQAAALDFERVSRD